MYDVFQLLLPSFVVLLFGTNAVAGNCVRPAQIFPEGAQTITFFETIQTDKAVGNCVETRIHIEDVCDIIDKNQFSHTQISIHVDDGKDYVDENYWVGESEFLNDSRTEIKKMKSDKAVIRTIHDNPDYSFASTRTEVQATKTKDGILKELSLRFWNKNFGKISKRPVVCKN